MSFNLVLFLGAGFSQPFGLPVMRDFKGFYQSSQRINADDKRFLNELFLEARRANSFLNSSESNLEDVLSYAMMGERLGIGEPRSERLRAILQRIYATAVNPSDYWDQFDAIQSFLGIDASRPLPFGLTIITTNYDVNAEAMLLSIGLEARHEFAPKTPPSLPVTVTRHLYGPDAIPVLKLHGSVNWFRSTDDPSDTFVEGRVVVMQSFDGEHRDLPLVCANDFKVPGDPVLVPPTFIKPDLPSPLPTIWRAAATQLQLADYIAFVGYSFPAADTEMRYFLGRTLAENVNLRKIFIVDKRAGQIVEEMRSADSAYGSHFKGHLEPIHGSWTGMHLPLPHRS